MNRNNFGLAAIKLEEIQRIIARRPSVGATVIFGSRAKGTYRPGRNHHLFAEDIP